MTDKSFMDALLSAPLPINHGWCPHCEGSGTTWMIMAKGDLSSRGGMWGQIPPRPGTTEFIPQQCVHCTMEDPIQHAFDVIQAKRKELVDQVCESEAFQREMQEFRDRFYGDPSPGFDRFVRFVMDDEGQDQCNRLT